MDLILKLNMDNSAFDPPGPELTRIFAKLSKWAEIHDERDSYPWHEVDSKIYDVNGNTVGKLTISKTP